MEHHARQGRIPLLATVVLVAVAGLFLINAWSGIHRPFGDSDDGINGAVWGYDTRSLRELGPIESRFGGVRLDGSKYATHPPLIVAETAVIEAIAGEHPWSTRAPAWLAALATIPLLFLLLRALALSPVVAAAAVAATLVCHFFFTYGSMLDTMIIALPFATASCLLWLRQWRDERPPGLAAVVVVALLTALAGWQGVFLVGLCGVSLAARHRTDRRRAVRVSLPWLGAAAVSVAITVGWGLWAYGSLDVLRERMGRRTGGADTSVLDMVTFQLPWLGQLLGVGLLALVGAAVSLRDERFRPLAALTLATVVLYAVILKEGSGGHQYWNYWALVPAAVGAGYALDALARWAGPRFGATGGAIVLPLALGAVAGGFNLAQPNQARELVNRGKATYELVELARLPPDQTVIPTIGEPNRADDWLRYRGGPPAESIVDEAQLRRLAAEHPDHLVLVLGDCADPDPTGICPQITFGDQPTTREEQVPPTIRPARDLAAFLR